ncbi:MAG: hypothetical protein ACRCXY_00690 [Fusobacteriaceae bacterium]
MKENSLKKVYSSIARARNFLDKTICEINDNIVLKIFDKENPKLVGIKNTKNISVEFLNELEKLNYFPHTIDKMSDRGRAIDINLKNPLTGRNMTGSSSATAINVLYGINNIGIGTDGGGSVLAPALSLNLYSILYKGIGIKGKESKKSTDNIEFTPGVGIISQYFEDIEIITRGLLKSNDSKVSLKKKANILVLNNVGDEILGILNEEKISFEKRDINLPDKREELISLGKNILKDFDIVIYKEEKIDLEGFGDSIFGTMGHESSIIQNNSNKKLIKVLNMINVTAITLPINEVSSGIVIFTREGEEHISELLEIGKKIDRERRTELFKKYFLDYSLQEIDNRYF